MSESVYFSRFPPHETANFVFIVSGMFFFYCIVLSERADKKERVKNAEYEKIEFNSA
jgi:hypothetical protein